MVYITVTENEQGAGMKQLLVKDILYMELNDRLTISVFTNKNKYFAVGNLRFWESTFKKAELHFIRLDRGVLANIEKIKAVDTYYKLAYFDSIIGRNEMRCTMSVKGYKLLCELFDINPKDIKPDMNKILKGLSWPTSPLKEY